MARKKLIKAFDENTYAVWEHGDGYVLYNKTKKGRYTNSMYVGYFSLTVGGKSYLFQGKEYKDIPSMLDAMEAYNKALPFCYELYNPVYKQSFFIEACVHEYLIRLGFKYENNLYRLEDLYGATITSLRVEVEEDKTTGKIIREIANSNQWVEINFNGLDAAIAACNTILAPYLLSTSISILSTLSQMTEDRSNEVIEEVSIDMAQLKVNTEDIRGQLIEKLETELNKLKNKC